MAEPLASFALAGDLVFLQNVGPKHECTMRKSPPPRSTIPTTVASS